MNTYTFAELGIKIADYNGMLASRAITLIINHVADRITMSQYAHPATSIETLYDWPATLVDMVNHRVKLLPIDADLYMKINS